MKKIFLLIIFIFGQNIFSMNFKRNNHDYLSLINKTQMQELTLSIRHAHKDRLLPISIFAYFTSFYLWSDEIDSTNYLIAQIVIAHEESGISTSFDLKNFTRKKWQYLKNKELNIYFDKEKNKFRIPELESGFEIL